MAQSFLLRTYAVERSKPTPETGAQAPMDIASGQAERDVEGVSGYGMRSMPTTFCVSPITFFAF